MKPNTNKRTILTALLALTLALLLAGCGAGSATEERPGREDRDGFRPVTNEKEACFMTRSSERRWGLLGVLLVLLAALASTAAAQLPDTTEVWLADQRNLVKIHRLTAEA